MQGILRKYVPADERVVLWMRPSVLFVLIRSFPGLVLIGFGMTGVFFLADATANSELKAEAILWGLLLMLVVLLWQLVEWLSRLYVVTERRLICVAGVLMQNVADVPLRNVRNVVLVRGVIERMLGLGTLGAASAGTGGYDVVWLLVPRPDEVLKAVRSAVDKAGAPVVLRIEEEKLSRAQPMPGPPKRPLVIGLTGGIGAGKSEVARLLGEHGYVVIDSDREAKAALDRPQVREELVKWWGARVLTPEGRIDRRAVAGIIFSDAQERRRLEQLVHPLVKASRAELVDRAAREGKPGVVVDAPLLLEVGSDKECDVIVFVESPRDQRLARVKATRAWDESEMQRRENAQLPLEEKRGRSDEVVLNDATPEVLRRQVDELVKKLATWSG